MNNLSVILSIVLIFMGSFTLLLAFKGRTRDVLPGYGEYTLCLISIALYLMGYALEISYGSIDEVLIAVRVQYLGIPFISLFAALFSYRFVEGKPLNRTVSLFLGIVPLLTVILVFSSDSHDLYYINPHMVEGELFQAFRFNQGPLYKIRFFYQVTISVVAVIFLVFKLTSEYKRRINAIASLIISQSILVGITIIYYLGIYSGDIDVVPFFTFLFAVIFSLTVLDFGKSEVLLKARSFALNSVGDSYFIIDKNRNIMDLNRSAAELDFIQLRAGHQLPSDNQFTAELLAAIHRGQSRFEYDKYGVRIYNFSPIISSSIHKCIMLQNNNDVIKLKAKLAYGRFYDSLTDIKNRKSIIEDLESEIDRVKSDEGTLSLIMADIDHLEFINRNYDIDTGDRLIKEISQILKDNINKNDNIGRIEGEAFLIVCPDSDKDLTLKMAERLKNLVEGYKLDLNGVVISTTCSFGVHTIKDGEETIADLLLKTEEALGISKEQGRNIVTYLA